jgi:hypothetical protein
MVIAGPAVIAEPAVVAEVSPATTATVQDAADVKHYRSDEPLRMGIEQVNRGNFGIAERYFRDPWRRPRRIPLPGSDWRRPTTGLHVSISPTVPIKWP